MQIHRTLDVGCGGSATFPTYKIRGDVNCDLHRPCCRMENFVQCDAQHLPFRTECFNKVTMYDVLEHLDAPVYALKEIHRVLKTNGNMELGTPNALWLPKIARSALKGFYAVEHTHIATYGYPELKQMCNRAGFQDVRVQYVSYLCQPERRVYEALVKSCPFPALRHRQLLAYGFKGAQRIKDSRQNE